MSKIGIKSPGKVSAASAKTAKGPGSSKLAGGIKKAISNTTKDAKESDSDTKAQENEELEQELVEKETETESREETALEKKKNLDQLLKRSLNKKNTEKETGKKDSEKAQGEKADKEWLDNSKAEESESRFKKAQKDGLQDQLKYDKDSIAEKYPGIERPGSGSSPQSQSPSNSGQGNSGGNNNSNGGGSNGSGGAGNGGSGGSGVSKLSGGSTQQGPQGNYGNYNPGRPGPGGGSHCDVCDSISKPGTKPDIGGGSGISKPDTGGGTVDPNPGTGGTPETLFSKYFSQGGEKTVEASSSEHAHQLAQNFKEIGAFKDINVDGNKITFSGFDASKGEDVHKAHGAALAEQWSNNDIKINFDSVDEAISDQFVDLLNDRASEFGIDNHDISKQCSDGTCTVSVGQQNEEQIQEQQQMPEQINYSLEEDGQTQIA